jgi:hypothetical protein
MKSFDTSEAGLNLIQRDAQGFQKSVGRKYSASWVPVVVEFGIVKQFVVKELEEDFKLKSSSLNKK